MPEETEIKEAPKIKKEKKKKVKKAKEKKAIDNQNYSTIQVPKRILNDIDELINKNGHYRNRTEFCMEAIRVYMREMKGK